MRNPARLAGLVLLGLMSAGPADAHKLKVFASAEGEVISGYAYFFGGRRAVGARLVVTGPDGAKLAELVTDAEGAFRFEATQVHDYRITVESGDGHAAAATIPAAELIAPLPEPGYAALLATAETPAEAPVAVPPDVAILIEAAVARQVRPLREQLDAWSERVFWRDVMGGLGFIIGFGGLAYGLTARRDKPRG